MRRLATLAFVLAAAAPAAAQDETVGFRAREWYARMSGTADSESNGSGSTEVDLAQDLGLGDRHWTTELQAYVHIPVVGRLYAGWWRAHDSGSEILNQQIEFAGRTFTVSTEVDSDFTIDVGYLNYEFVFPTIPLGDLVKLEFGVELGARAIKGDATISDSAQTAHDSGVVGLPTLGAHVTARLFDYVRTEVEVLGLAFKYADNEVHYLEMFAEATIEPLPWIYAGAGYKLAEVNLQHRGSDSFHVNIDISGFYLTVGIRF
jgi:hypothetical protein